MAAVLVGVTSSVPWAALERRLVEHLSSDAGQGTLVERLPGTAVGAAERIGEVTPRALVVVGVDGTGRVADAVARRRIVRSEPLPVGPDDVRAGGRLQLLLGAAAALGVLPDRTVALEVDGVAAAAPTGGRGGSAVEQALAMTRAEARRMPLLGLADEVRTSLGDGHLAAGTALDAMESLLGQLEVLDREGRWGRTFSERDRLRAIIAEGDLAEGMTYLDWGLWWGLIEELDRLQGLEAVER